MKLSIVISAYNEALRLLATLADYARDFVDKFKDEVELIVVVHGLFGLDVRDSQCRAKLFRRGVVENVLSESIEPDWAFDIDLLCRLKRHGYSIREFPIEWHQLSG
jgi:hypothetical protein